jgi:hypothetical protein
MRIQPRQQLLETWRAVALSAYPDRTWIWGGDHERNSISDAEQLLCLMAPATKIDSFKLDLPDETAEDVLAALGTLGDSVELPRLLMRVLADYLRAYVDDDGRPVFSGGSYFISSDSAVEPTAAQRDLDVVDSYSTSVQLMLATIGFLRVFRGVITRDELRREVDKVEAMASERLTAAMIGLLRSFTVHVFDVNSVEGRGLCRTVNQLGQARRRVVEDLQRELRDINAGLRDLTIGIDPNADLDNPNRLFECGWSWGVVNGAPVVNTTGRTWQQPEGVAQPAPYLYFTAVALDGIQDLFTERTRLLGLLDEEQHRLARTLQIRWDLTQQYWSRIASFGEGRWPLEDIPWRTVDDLESDCFTLLVASIMVQALSQQPAADVDLSRVGRVLDDLASRARITRRAAVNDPAIPLHSPGVAVALEGSEIDGGPQLSWLIADFSPQLLRRTIRVAGLLRTAELRGPLLDLADSIWDHLALRRHRDSACQLWDQPAEIYAEIKPDPPQPSWYYTRRVVEALVAAAGYVASPPLRGPRSMSLAGDQLAEAEHLFDQEMLVASADAAPALAAVLQTARTTLRRAREILPDRPATALVLANDVLRELERLAAARISTPGMG